MKSSFQFRAKYIRRIFLSTVKFWPVVEEVITNLNPLGFCYSHRLACLIFNLAAILRKTASLTTSAENFNSSHAVDKVICNSCKNSNPFGFLKF